MALGWKHLRGLGAVIIEYPSAAGNGSVTTGRDAVRQCGKHHIPTDLCQHCTPQSRFPDWRMWRFHRKPHKFLLLRSKARLNRLRSMQIRFAGLLPIALPDIFPLHALPLPIQRTVCSRDDV